MGKVMGKGISARGRGKTPSPSWWRRRAKKQITPNYYPSTGPGEHVKEFLETCKSVKLRI